ncbi:MAG TPA: LLM class flavin-dependent oxidoreductase [Candidatus Binataceae bacterium]|nr:LLM class flavin-dependent oxidoreductase [Candidatus Binataceae bacterium]
MKFGVFLPNGTNGYILSTRSPQYPPTYEHNRAITVEAERQGLEFALSMIKFRGFGGEGGYWDACLESFTLMAALARDTSSIYLFPSVGILSMHPAVAARMVATIDDISGGRCGLNIVTGWNRPEYQQMGLWPGDQYYDQRYEYATEYLQIMKALWRDGRVSHHGAFFDLPDCRCLPTPRREIAIVCAGSSPRGMRFTAELGDHNFVTADRQRLKTIGTQLGTHAIEFGRSVGTYAQFVLIAAESDAQARRQADDIIAGADLDAIRNVLSSASLDTNPGGTSEALRTGMARPVELGNIVFMGTPVILGSYESCAQQIDELARDTGVDGLLLSFPDFVGGIRNFGEKIMPILACREATA